VGRRREPFAIGWKSGTAALAAALGAMGETLDEAGVKRLLPLVRQRARELQRTLTPEELLDLHHVNLNTGGI
jgi:hypothetical protein